MTIQQQVGEQIKKIRQENKLTQQKLADAAAIDQKYISNIEQGKVNTTLETIHRLADVLNKKVIIEFR